MTEQEFIQQAEGLKGRLYRTAWLYLGSEACAVDAVDEAVYQGFLHYKRLRQPEYFATWMTRILINACNAELRRRKRELAVAELPETAGACWKAFQERQRLQRQAKKKYLKFYGALCAQSLRQLTAGQSRRPAW